MARVAQARVECASLALALHETRRFVWDRLDDSVRERIVGWMSGIAGAWVPENNWVWFRAVTAAFLRSVGAAYRAEDIEYAIACTEQWYAGDGWYSDGAERTGELRAFDYYNGWALHFYPLWFCRIAGADAPAGLLDRYRGRLRRYLTDAQHLIGADGAPVMQGRSLTYRYAMLAPFWAGAVFDATPLEPGLTRRLASGVLRHFIRGGCFDGRGLQTIGWYHPFTPIRQGYSGPGSPYWSSKGFAGLVLPDDHPVWTATEQASAAQLGDVTVALAAPGWLVSSTAADGVVRVAAHGGDHSPTDLPALDDEVYARHGFSSHAAPQMTEQSRGAPLDSHVALLAGDGRPSHRRPATPLGVAGHTAASRHRAHWAAGTMPDRYGFDQQAQHWSVGPWVTTASVLRGGVEIRLCRVDPAMAEPQPELSADPGPWHLRVGGWAIAGDQPPRCIAVGAGVGVARGDGLSSALIGLRGLGAHGVVREDGANPLGRHSAIPWVATGEPVEFGEVYAAAVVLSGDPGALLRAAEVRVRVDRVDADGADVEVRWPDGTGDRVRLDAPGAF